MIKGYDMSHYQGRTYKKFLDGNFYFFKATEGITFKDPKMIEMANFFKTRKKVIGFYHFAHPEKDDWKKEADHFIEIVKPFLPCILALDWEADALKCDIKWAKKWLDYVKKKTGIAPLIYCSSSYVKTFKDTLKDEYGLWVARYSTQPPERGYWKTWAVWQFTDKPVDTDYFNGTIDQLKKYGGVV